MEKERGGKKLQYEKTELIDIRERGAAGAPGCTPGSGASGCDVGTSANNYCDNGTSAEDWCRDGAGVD